MPAKRKKTESSEESHEDDASPTIVVPASVTDVVGAVSGNKAYCTLPAPDFKADAIMPDKSFGKVALSDYKGKYLVLFFYPLDWTFVCPTEIIAFSEALSDFKAVNCEVKFNFYVIR